jgi:hypothetical protein
MKEQCRFRKVNPNRRIDEENEKWIVVGEPPLGAENLGQWTLANGLGR